ncbi:MAG: adenylate/guanylate cyclase domain-containing protein [Candidatus Nitrohelix vancouverensis]|uniref:Adenylate/guanylate cyclase domain-containing protein n=1 Tax=Candidatus Nitrohelix vancouverensis TaxID=2705534 RepID=A0A7T0C088_9BACT|nr:MAG: adenylate/guanylate cyclase domain-containing protein [Candidatus Nitrohelix vancouverensis]
MPRSLHWPIAFLVIFLSTYLLYVNPVFLQKFESIFQDLNFRWRGETAPGPNIAIAAIDEKSMDQFGRWPWPRATISKLIERLTEMEAKVIGFDVVFSSPELNPGAKIVDDIETRLLLNGLPKADVDQSLLPFKNNAEPDLQFAQTIRDSKRTVLGYFLHHSLTDTNELTLDSVQTNIENIESSRFQNFIKSSGALQLDELPIRPAYGAEANIKTISKSTRDAGFLSFDVEPDGSIRWLPLIVKLQNPKTKESSFFPPFSIRVVEKYLDGALILKAGPTGIDEVLLDAEEAIPLPVDLQGRIFINYLGRQNTFPHYSIADILQGLVPPETFKDKIVLVGATAQGLKDIRNTAFDPIMPGIEIHATVIDNILRQNFIVRPQWAPLAEALYLLIAGIALTLVYTRIRPSASVFFWLFVTAAQFILFQWLFTSKQILFTNFYAHLEHFLLFTSITIYRYRAEEKQKKQIKNIFGQYVSPTVIEQILQDPENISLGGEQKELTAYFTDLAGFSAVSEQLSAQELVALLNEYLSAMTDVLLAHEGTLDKYDGDAIKAFFGAPIYFPDHALRACLVCIEMQERLRELNKLWESQGRPTMGMRVGVNTGQMVVGNLGSRERMNYGMNGDSVNLAARLEGVNKLYGTESIISESTYLQAKDHLEVRELDLVKVVGRKTPVRIYELLAKKGALDDTLKESYEIFAVGLQNYRAQQWDQAIERFNHVLERTPLDRPSQLLIERCERFKLTPPEIDWDGSFTLTSK